MRHPGGQPDRPRRGEPADCAGARVVGARIGAAYVDGAAVPLELDDEVGVATGGERGEQQRLHAPSTLYGGEEPGRDVGLQPHLELPSGADEPEVAAGRGVAADQGGRGRQGLHPARGGRRRGGEHVVAGLGACPRGEGGRRRQACAREEGAQVVGEDPPRHGVDRDVVGEHDETHGVGLRHDDPADEVARSGIDLGPDPAQLAVQRVRGEDGEPGRRCRDDVGGLEADPQPQGVMALQEALRGGADRGDPGVDGQEDLAHLLEAAPGSAAAHHVAVPGQRRGELQPGALAGRRRVLGRGPRCEGLGSRGGEDVGDADSQSAPTQRPDESHGEDAVAAGLEERGGRGQRGHVEDLRHDARDLLAPVVLAGRGRGVDGEETGPALPVQRQRHEPRSGRRRGRRTSLRPSPAAVGVGRGGERVVPGRCEPLRVGVTLRGVDLDLEGGSRAEGDGRGDGERRRVAALHHRHAGRPHAARGRRAVAARVVLDDDERVGDGAEQPADLSEPEVGRGLRALERRGDGTGELTGRGGTAARRPRRDADRPRRDEHADGRLDAVEVLRPSGGGEQVGDVVAAGEVGQQARPGRLADRRSGDALGEERVEDRAVEVDGGDAALARRATEAVEALASSQQGGGGDARELGAPHLLRRLPILALPPAQIVGEDRVTAVIARPREVLAQLVGEDRGRPAIGEEVVHRHDEVGGRRTRAHPRVSREPARVEGQVPLEFVAADPLQERRDACVIEVGRVEVAVRHVEVIEDDGDRSGQIRLPHGDAQALVPGEPRGDRGIDVVSAGRAGSRGRLLLCRQEVEAQGQRRPVGVGVQTVRVDVDADLGRGERQHPLEPSSRHRTCEMAEELGSLLGGEEAERVIGFAGLPVGIDVVSRCGVAQCGVARGGKRLGSGGDGGGCPGCEDLPGADRPPAPP